jgi:hypothetical protein
MFAFFITTFVRKTRIAILIGIFIFIVGLLFESFVFSGGFLGYLWWSPETISSAGWIILVFFPFFNFGRMFLDITTLTTGLLDTLTQTYIPGPGFPWATLYPNFPNASLPTYGANGTPDVPPPVFSWYFMIMNCFVFGFLLWYLDNVIPNEFGMSRPPWFFATFEYWGISTSKSTSTNKAEWQKRVNSLPDLVEEGEDSDVVAERVRALDPADDSALKIAHLRKVYNSYSLFKGVATKVAVRNSCFTVEEGKLLALLGQNGKN